MHCRHVAQPHLPSAGVPETFYQVCLRELVLPPPQVSPLWSAPSFQIEGCTLAGIQAFSEISEVFSVYQSMVHCYGVFIHFNLLSSKMLRLTLLHQPCSGPAFICPSWDGRGSKGGGLSRLSLTVWRVPPQRDTVLATLSIYPCEIVCLTFSHFIFLYLVLAVSFFSTFLSEHFRTKKTTYQEIN